MAQRPKPSPLEVEFGNKLRQYRTDRRMTVAHVARQGAMSPSKLSRIELGQLPASENDITSIAAILDLSSQQTRGLVTEAALLRNNAWRSQIENNQQRQETLSKEAEAAATDVKQYGAEALPGSLQTVAYATAVAENYIEIFNDKWLNIDDFLPQRLKRQAALFDARRNFQFVINPGTLTSSPSPSVDLQAEVEHLCRLARRPNIDIRVLDAQKLPPILHCFGIWDENSVCVDTLTSEFFFRDAVTVDLYKRAFQYLLANSISILDRPRDDILDLTTASDEPIPEC